MAKGSSLVSLVEVSSVFTGRFLVGLRTPLSAISSVI